MCAANPSVQVRGPTDASSASLTSVPPAPPRAYLPERHHSVVLGPNGRACRLSRVGRGWPARGVGHLYAVGASTSAAPCSTLMMAPRRATTPAHPGTRRSWPARGRLSRERTGRGAGTERRAMAPLAKCPVRLTGRDRGANAAGRHLYVRAGRGCEWASTACCRSLLFTPPGTPAPLVSVSLCVSVPSAPSTVCLHGTGGCASCRDGK